MRLSGIVLLSALLAAPHAGGQGDPNAANKAGEVRIFEGHKGMVDSVAFSPCGKLAVSGVQGHDDADGNVLEFHVRLWDLDGKQPLLRLLKGHAGGVRGVAFSADGKHVLSGSTDGTARLWTLPK